MKHSIKKSFELFKFHCNFKNKQKISTPFFANSTPIKTLPILLLNSIVYDRTKWIAWKIVTNIGFDVNNFFFRCGGGAQNIMILNIYQHCWVHEWQQQQQKKSLHCLCHLRLRAFLSLSLSDFNISLLLY